MMASPGFQISFLFIALLCLDLSFGHGGPGFCSAPAHGKDHHSHHHNCDHSHGHHHHHHHHHHDEELTKSRLLPEELAEEEDLKLYGIGSHLGHHDHHHHGHGHEHLDDTQLSGVALWVHALGCSFLVSMASLVCLILLPLLFIQGRPSKTVVDSLALFGAGAMLGDAFLHQLPHAFGGGHSHSHDHNEHSHSHDHHADDAHAHSGHDHSHGHAHSLEDLSIGISVLVGIILFLLVEKLVRYVEENSRGANSWTHGHHHHHHHKNSKKSKDINESSENVQSQLSSKTNKKGSEKNSEEISDSSSKKDHPEKTKSVLRKRNTTAAAGADDKSSEVDGADVTPSNDKGNSETESVQSPSNLVFGYLNLFSDGVHNFTDGMALGSAFLLYGPVGGWSRTLFLLAHELPQEVGDFGILVRSGFSVSKALFFNFLSALVALAGTALALVLGRDPGQSSLIEGFTAGGFIYIAVAGVLAEMNNGKTTLKSTVIEITSLMLGMAVALCISLVE